MADKILIADDDDRINELLQEIFTMEGYEVEAAYDGEEAIHILKKENDIHLVVLDVMMPKLNGWDVLAYIKKTFDVKVLILTALGSETDEVRGLRSGADDYVAKPFRRAVLLERVKRLLSEYRLVRDKDFYCGELCLKQSQCKVYIGNEEIKLTTKEYQLLQLLIKNNKVVLGRDTILDKIWGVGYDGNDRTVDTHIKMLRHSLGEPYNKYIRTVRGVGYCFDGDVTES